VEFFLKPVDLNALVDAVKRIVPRPMRLRDHALIRNWPPVWTKFTKPISKTVPCEIGVLSEVHFENADSKKCFLLIEHQGEFFTGALIFHDERFGHQIAALLQRQVGRSITEIGAMDLNHMF
jgi:hypothetical protein